MPKLYKQSTGFDDLINLFHSQCIADAEVNQPFNELRSSLASVMDAMHNFITNIRLPERPNDADVDENESTDDEANDYLT